MTTWVCTVNSICDQPEPCIYKGSRLSEHAGCGEGTWTVQKEENMIQDDQNDLFKPGIIIEKEEGRFGPVLKIVQHRYGRVDNNLFEALEKFLSCLSEYSIKRPTKYAIPNKKAPND